jgi:hypothetical protein
MSILELRLAHHKPLRIGISTAQPLPGVPRTRRTARYMVGTPHWDTLVAALRSHHCLDG